MQVIITCGFQSIDTSCFRKKSLFKGKKLLESYHVSDVKEIIDHPCRRVIGTVLRETPGAHSAKKHNTYTPEVQVFVQLYYSRNSIIHHVDRVGAKLRKLTNYRKFQEKQLKHIFRPPNLGNIALPYTLGQGRCDFPYNVKNF
jgi:hypothetical protein